MADRGRVSLGSRSPNPKHKPKTNFRKAMKARALTVENVYRAVRELEGTVTKVDDSSSYGLGFYLRVPIPVLSRIARSHPDPADRLREVVTYFLKTDPAASWRRVIWAVQRLGAHYVTDEMRHLAEPVRDPTLTLHNMRQVLQTVNGLWKLGGNILALPQPVLNQIHLSDDNKDNSQKKEAMINHYVQYHPLASWAHLCGRLYYMEEYKALEEARQYISQQREPCLNLANLTSALEGLADAEKENWWLHLATHLNLPQRKQSEIKKHFQNNKDRKTSSLDTFLATHPAPSWWLVAEALCWMMFYTGKDTYRTALERVVKVYPTARFHSKHIFDQEMRHGHTLWTYTKAVMMGITGAGKTSVTAVILGEDPPQVHESSSLMERPVQAVVVHVDTVKWIRKDPTEMHKILADLAKAKRLQQKVVLVMNKPQSHPTQMSAPFPPTTSLDGSGQPQPQVHVASDIRGDTTDVLNDPAESHFEFLLQSCNCDRDFVTHITKSVATSETVLYENFVHILDSGGQPQFMDVLQVFLKNTSACIFVMRLCDALDQNPTVGYYKQGSPLGKVYPSAHTNGEIFRKVVRTIRSFRSMKNRCKPPKILVVGTHKDLEHRCPQPRKEKNKMLNSMLTPDLQEHIIYCNHSLQELIFPLNAKKPGVDDKNVATEIRRIIMEECMIEPEEVPLRWHLFLQKLILIAENLRRKVLKKSECIRIANTVGCDTESCEAALEFFNDLNQLFYFPEILPNVVFVDPMVLIDKITELVIFSYELRGGSFDGDRVQAISGEWRKFRDFGRVSEHLLKSFPKHYQPDVFTPKELVKLLCTLLVFGDFSEGEWFMPSLLTSLCNPCLKERCSSGRQAMGVCFPDGGPQNGLFCSLQSFLPSTENVHPKPWEIAFKKGKPMCFKCNCMVFKFPGFPATVTVIDRFNYFEIHVSTDPSFRQELWRHVRAAVFAGLKRAANIIGYISNKPEPAMLCPAHPEENHLATVDEGKMVWACLEDPDERGKIMCEDYLWITPSITTETSSNTTSMFTVECSSHFLPTAQLPGQMRLRNSDTDGQPTRRKMIAMEHHALHSHDLHDLLTFMGTVAAKWRFIGLALGFSTGELDIIAKTSSNNGPLDYLRDLLDQWLKRAPPKHRRATVEDVIEALRSPTVGEEVLAMELDEKMGTQYVFKTEERLPAPSGQATHSPGQNTRRRMATDQSQKNKAVILPSPVILEGSATSAVQPPECSSCIKMLLDLFFCAIILLTIVVLILIFY